MIEILRNTLVWGGAGIVALFGYAGLFYLAIWIFVNPYPYGIWFLFGFWILWTAFLIAVLAHVADRVVRKW